MNKMQEYGIPYDIKIENEFGIVYLQFPKKVLLKKFFKNFKFKKVSQKIFHKNFKHFLKMRQEGEKI